MEIDDHRAIGSRQDLFHQQEEGPGMVFWHPRGFALYRVIVDYVRRQMRRAGYREVATPQLLARSLWEASGHWEKFGANMFAIEDGNRAHALKPMSCPGHIQIFNKGVRSFRDLPLRYAEFGACMRNEPSGALMGLFRTRAFVQDDAHVFCREDQVADEVHAFCELLIRAYRDFGFDDVAIRFADRPAGRAGSDADWDEAEALLKAAIDATGLPYDLNPGEGAFYGPKLEFHLKDRAGRSWQCGTIQVDRVLPERLGAHYTDAGGERRRPVLLHHAVLGSIERFIGMLLEHHKGQLPLWLAPDQIAVASVADKHADYAVEVAGVLEDEGFRVVLDDRPERLPKKVAEAHEAGIPVFVAVGAREAADGTVTLRRRDGSQKTLVLDAAIAALRAEAGR